MLYSLTEAVRAFRAVPLDGCVITKLDEATSLGSALSVSIQYGIPVAYVSHGQRVPEDISPARAHTLVIRAVAMAEQRGRACADESLELAFGGMTANARF